MEKSLTFQQADRIARIYANTIIRVDAVEQWDKCYNSKMQQLGFDPCSFER